MRKLLAIVSVLALGQAANAESNFSTSAESRTRVQNDMNTSAAKDGGITQNEWEHRLKLGLGYNLGEKLSLNTTLIHNAIWGQGNAYRAGDAAGASPVTGDDGPGIRNGVGDAQNMLLVNEFYTTWAISDSTSLRFGRGSFTLADGSVVSENDWERNPYAFDGAMITHDMEFGRLSGFFVKFADLARGENAIEDPEVNAYGLSLDIKAVPDAIKMLNLHAIKVNQDELDASTMAGQDIMRYGVTVGGETSGVDFNFTYAMVSGEHVSERLNRGSAGNQDISSTMMDLKLGYTLEDVMGLRVGFDYHTDSGSSSATKDETYDSFYYQMHQNAGKMDIFRWGNLTYMGVNLSVKPMENTTVGVDYYMFTRTEKKDNTVNLGRNANGFAGVGILVADEDDLGTEIDVWASHKYDNGLEIKARYSMFTPGDAFKGSAEDTYSLAFLEAKATF